MSDLRTIPISYGRGHLPVRMPAAAKVTTIGKLALPKIVDPASAVRRALTEPIGSKPLARLAQGRGSACVLICDITRPVPNRLFLWPMVETMVVAGVPLDKTYYQTIKGMVTPLDILEPGGTLIIASACSKGFGPEEFLAAQRRLIELGLHIFLATLTAKSLADVDEWQTEMQLKSMRVGRIELYTSGLSAEEREITGVEMMADVDEAVARSVARTNDLAVAVIPEGPYVVPYFDGGRSHAA